MNSSPSAGRAPTPLPHRGPHTLPDRRAAVTCSLIRRFGVPDPFHWSVSTDYYGKGFTALILHIISIQISPATTLGIFVKLEAASHSASASVTPVAVLTDGQLILPQCGVAHAKPASVPDVSSRIVSGTSNRERPIRHGDEDVVGALTAARGVRPWTAKMLLVHQLRHPDVLPTRELGSRHGVQIALGSDVTPAIADAADITHRWSTHHIYAAAFSRDPFAPTAQSRSLTGPLRDVNCVRRFLCRTNVGGTCRRQPTSAPAESNQPHRTGAS